MPRARKHKEGCHLIKTFISEPKFWSSQALISPGAGDSVFSNTESQGGGALLKDTLTLRQRDRMLPGHIWPLMSVPYGCNWFQNLLSVPTHLATATRHLLSPLLFFPDQVTYPGRIRPRLCSPHSFLTSFLFSVPGGSWTVSPLACKCICASGIQWSVSVWTHFSSFLLSFCSCVVWKHDPSPDLVGHCWLELNLPDFPKWGQE